MSRHSRRAGVLVLSLCAACHRAAPPAPGAATEVQTGVASFYDNGFAGRRTASGDRLALDEMTAASRTLPLGTRVRVVNAETGRSAAVTINDRGPYAEDRVIDLTPRAARRIGIDRDKGVARVHVRTVAPAPAPAQSP